MDWLGRVYRLYWLKGLKKYLEKQTKPFIQSAEINRNKVENTGVVVAPSLMLAASWLAKI